jgi:hypothetical protein
MEMRFNYWPFGGTIRFRISRRVWEKGGAPSTYYEELGRGNLPLDIFVHIRANATPDVQFVLLEGPTAIKTFGYE